MSFDEGSGLGQHTADCQRAAPSTAPRPASISSVSPLVGFPTTVSVPPGVTIANGVPESSSLIDPTGLNGLVIETASSPLSAIIASSPMAGTVPVLQSDVSVLQLPLAPLFQLSVDMIRCLPAS